MKNKIIFYSLFLFPIFWAGIRTLSNFKIVIPSIVIYLLNILILMIIILILSNRKKYINNYTKRKILKNIIVFNIPFIFFSLFFLIYYLVEKSYLNFFHKNSLFTLGLVLLFILHVKIAFKIKNTNQTENIAEQHPQ